MSLTRFTKDTPVIDERMNQMCDEIDQQINVLNTSLLKYMSVRAFPSSGNIYDCTSTGIYLTNVSGVNDLPTGWAQGRHVVVTFNPNNNLYGFQIITTYAGSAGAGGNRKFAIRHAISSNSYWLDIVTSTMLQSALDALNA